MESPLYICQVVVAVVELYMNVQRFPPVFPLFEVFSLSLVFGPASVLLLTLFSFKNEKFPSPYSNGVLHRLSVGFTTLFFERVALQEENLFYFISFSLSIYLE